MELLGGPAWPRHLAQLTRELRSRRDHLLRQLQQHLPQLVPVTVPRGGLNLWLTLPRGLDDVDIADRARARQLLIAAGRPYYVTEPPGPRVGLSFTAADRPQASAGVQVLSDVLAEAGMEREV